MQAQCPQRNDTMLSALSHGPLQIIHTTSEKSTFPSSAHVTSLGTSQSQHFFAVSTFSTTLPNVNKSGKVMIESSDDVGMVGMTPACSSACLLSVMTALIVSSTDHSFDWRTRRVADSVNPSKGARDDTLSLSSDDIISRVARERD